MRPRRGNPWAWRGPGPPPSKPFPSVPPPPDKGRQASGSDHAVAIRKVGGTGQALPEPSSSPLPARPCASQGRGARRVATTRRQSAIRGGGLGSPSRLLPRSCRRLTRGGPRREAAAPRQPADPGDDQARPRACFSPSPIAVADRSRSLTDSGFRASRPSAPGPPSPRNPLSRGGGRGGENGSGEGQALPRTPGWPRRGRFPTETSLGQAAMREGAGAHTMTV